MRAGGKDGRMMIAASDSTSDSETCVNEERNVSHNVNYVRFRSLASSALCRGAGKVVEPNKVRH